MSALLDWWGYRFGSYSPRHGLWFRADGHPLYWIIWGPSYPHCNGWWVDPWGDVREHLVSFTALTFPA